MMERIRTESVWVPMTQTTLGVWNLGRNGKLSKNHVTTGSLTFTSPKRRSAQSNFGARMRVLIINLKYFFRNIRWLKEYWEDLIREGWGIFNFWNKCISCIFLLRWLILKVNILWGINQQWYTDLWLLLLFHFWGYC